MLFIPIIEVSIPEDGSEFLFGEYNVLRKLKFLRDLKRRSVPDVDNSIVVYKAERTSTNTNEKVQEYCYDGAGMNFL